MPAILTALVTLWEILWGHAIGLALNLEVFFAIHQREGDPRQFARQRNPRSDL